MSLVEHINRGCPNISHAHKKGGELHLYDLKSKCFVCCPIIRSSLDVTFNCGAKHLVRKKLTTDAKITLHLIFSKQGSRYYIPQELEDILFFCCENTLEDEIKKIDKHTLKHIMKCRPCSLKLLKMFERKACTHHMLPRLVSGSWNGVWLD